MQILRIGALENKVQLKHSKIYAMIADGDFPKPIKLGPRAVGWIEGEVDDWLRQRASERDKVAA